MPLRHKAKFSRFRRLYPDLPFFAEFATLLAELYPKRERSLYADIEYGKIVDPTLEYSKQDAEETLARTREMVDQIESLLRGHH